MIWMLGLSLVVTTPVTLNVRVHGSIEATLAARAPEHAAAIAAQVARVLRWKGDIVRNVQPDDELRLIFESGETPELLAVTYLGAEIQARAYRFADETGIARFYDETGKLAEPWLLAAPLASYVQITEVVQTGRGKRRHSGLDLKTPEGTAVILPFAGRVARVNWSTRVNGKCIEVVYTTGVVARFLHLAEVDPAVNPGVRLAAGARLGAAGSTGRSSAPHLHYDLHDAAGKVLDPLVLHGTKERSLAESQRPTFDTVRKDYDRLMGATDNVSGATR